MLETLLREELDELRAANLYRRLLTLERRAGCRAMLDGREVLLFCGNDYLGLSRHPRVIEAARAAAGEYGTGAGASRLISGTSAWHTRLEEKIAALKKKERALVFTAGYLANLGILTAVAREGDLILMDKLCHASIIDGARLSGASVRTFPHKNYERCEQILAKSYGYKKKVLVSDAVFSMDGDLADVERLAAIKKKYGAVLILDDAHGTGVLGPEGRGTASEKNLDEDVDILMGTLSKAVGCLGGFAAASGAWIDYLINFSRPFIFATALPPMLCAAALEAFKVIEEEPSIRARLWKNIQKVHEGLQSMGIPVLPVTSPILPVIVGDEKDALAFSEDLLKKEIFVPAVRYPTVPKHKARLRVTVSSAHQESDLERLLLVFRNLQKKYFIR